MRIGIGLPGNAPDVLLDWARRAEAGPFDTITVSDRVVGDNVEPLIALAAVAGATSRLHLRTQLLLATLREPALLAKQLATVDRLSRGRLSLGVGVGEREDDFLACGVGKAERARRMDRYLPLFRDLWAGKPFADDIGPIGPRPASDGGPELLFGGFSEAAVQRVARWGTGYISPGRAEHSGWMFGRIFKAWEDAGRPGKPKLIAQANTALGSPYAIGEAQNLVRSYYSFLDTPGSGATFTSDDVVNLMLTSPEQIREAIAGCERSGVHEMVFVFWSAIPQQLDQLAGALG